jgi:ABC-2 type transport system ATP-binding protein
MSDPRTSVPHAADREAGSALPVTDMGTCTQEGGRPMTGSSAAVELTAASLTRGRVTLVHELSFRIEPATICGLLAPSGGGKTTTLRLITGVYLPTTGMVRVFGRSPDRFTLADRGRIGYMPQQFVLYPGLSVRRNLEFVAGIYGLAGAARTARIDELLATVDLTAARDRQAGRLSGGMQRRLQLAATMLHQPDLLIIDEPTAGIDPILRARFWEYFRHLRDAGRTLLITTQYVTEAEHCDQVVMLRAGRIVAAGSPEAIRARAFGAEALRPGQVPPSFEDVFVRVMAAAATPEERP